MKNIRREEKKKKRERECGHENNQSLTVPHLIFELMMFDASKKN